MEEVDDCFPGNTPGSPGEVDACQTAVPDHAVDGAFGDEQEVGHLIRPEETFLGKKFDGHENVLLGCVVVWQMVKQEGGQLAQGSPDCGTVGAGGAGEES